MRNQITVLLLSLLASPGQGIAQELPSMEVPQYFVSQPRSCQCSGPQTACMCGGDPETCGSDAAPYRVWDALELFVGLEGSKQPQDFGVNAHFGGRLHANLGLPLWEEAGLGFQLGTAVNLTDHAVRVTSQIDGADSRQQSFSTVGLFQRLERWTWGVGHDFLVQEDYSTTFLSQWRGRVGYFLTAADEIGVLAMLPQESDSAIWAGVPVRLRPIAQGSGYWRHTWEGQAEITGWLGLAEGHGQANAALGDAPAKSECVVFGADVHVPLNDRWALFGEANFITPADTGTVDAYLGLAYYPGGGARGWRKKASSPVLPVANNTSMSVDLTR